MGLTVADPTSPTGLDGLFGSPTGLAQYSVPDSSPTGLAAACTLPTGLGVLAMGCWFTHSEIELLVCELYVSESESESVVLCASVVLPPPSAVKVHGDSD